MKTCSEKHGPVWEQQILATLSPDVIMFFNAPDGVK